MEIEQSPQTDWSRDRSRWPSGAKAMARPQPSAVSGMTLATAVNGVDGGSGSRITTGVPSASWVCPVVTTAAVAGSSLLVTSIQPCPWLPVLMSLIDRALPFSTMKSLVTPANRTIESRGTTAALASASVMIDGLGEATGPEQPALVGNQGFYLKRAARRVDRGVDRGRPAPSIAIVGMSTRREPYSLADPHVFGVLLGNLAPEADRVFDHELGDRFAFLDHLPFRDLPLGDSVRQRAGAREAGRQAAWGRGPG